MWTTTTMVYPKDPWISSLVFCYCWKSTYWWFKVYIILFFLWFLTITSFFFKYLHGLFLYRTITADDERSRITALGSSLLSHLLDNQKDETKKSIQNLWNQYFDMIKRYNDGIQESGMRNNGSNWILVMLYAQELIKQIFRRYSDLFVRISSFFTTYCGWSCQR